MEFALDKNDSKLRERERKSELEIKSFALLVISQSIQIVAASLRGVDLDIWELKWQHLVFSSLFLLMAEVRKLFEIKIKYLNFSPFFLVLFFFGGQFK